MYIAELSTSVANIMAGQLQGVGGAVADQARNHVATMLYGLVAAKLRATPVGARALDALEAAPTDIGSVDQVAQSVNDEVQRDPEFGSQLQRLVQQLGQSGQGRLVRELQR